MVLPAADAPAPATRWIDATGLVIAPGFIDIHRNSDFWPEVDPLATSREFDGVTMEISGNYGLSGVTPGRVLWQGPVAARAGPRGDA